MSKVIAIIQGTTRAGGNTIGLTQWVKVVAQKKFPDATIKVFTAREPFDLVNAPLGAIPAAYVQKSEDYSSEVVQKFSKELYAASGIIFVTPTYNHSYPGELKIAIDHLCNEFKGKPVAIVAHAAGASPSHVSDSLAALVTKLGAQVTGKVGFQLPAETYTTAKRVEPSDEFLKPLEAELEAAIAKF